MAMTEVPQEQNQAASIWLVSFVDLMSLMLTFFVLMFSMSTLDEAKYRQMTTSIDETNMTAKNNPTVAKIQRIEIKRQVNIDYLATLLAEHITQDELLRKLKLVKRGNELAFVLPIRGSFLDVSSKNLTEQFKNQLFAVGGLFATVTNKIEVRVMTPVGKNTKVGDYSSGIELAIARATVIANALKQGGAAGELAAMFAPAISRNQRIEIVVMAAGME